MNALKHGKIRRFVAGLAILASGALFQNCGGFGLDTFGLGDFGWGLPYFSDPLEASRQMSAANDAFLNAVDAWDIAYLRS